MLTPRSRIVTIRGMAQRELPRKRLRERVAERKAREAERPTTFFDHIVGSVTPGSSSLDPERKSVGDVWRGHALKGGYLLMALSLILLMIQVIPFVRGGAMNVQWMLIIVYVVIFLIGRALVFAAKFAK